jgi:Pentapeptide repeats (9 copies)
MLVIVLFSLGQWLTRTEHPPHFLLCVLDILKIDWSYVRALGPEIGGSGIDAVVISSITGIVVSLVNRKQEFEEQCRRIHRRREGRGSVNLEEELLKSAGTLPLWGLKFVNAKIEFINLKRTRFSKSGESSSNLSIVNFNGCDLVDIDFRGCELVDVVFNNCTITRCDFRNAKLIVTMGSQMFTMSTLRFCRFNGAVFIDVNMSDVEQRGCSFWEATVKGGGRLPSYVFANLDEHDRHDISGDETGYKVNSLRAFLLRPSLTRLYFILCATFGLHNR